jgi:pilus assembly protein CpaB
MQRSIISLIVGVVLAVVAVALLYNYISGLQVAVTEPVVPATTNVVVATEDIPFGQTIVPQNLRLVSWPQESIPLGSFTSVDEVLASAQGENRIALTAIVAGEPLLRSRISGFGERPILSRQVSEGMRAISIRIDDVIGVAGFVLPGDRVDILLTRNDEDNANLMVTDIVLQNITVLGIDQSADQRTDEPIVARTATVEVTPDQAQRLALAQRAGTLSLALRGSTTVDEVEVLQVDVRDLANRRTAPGAAVGPSVRVRNGSEAPVARSVRP